jgi:hypothetical protein
MPHRFVKQTFSSAFATEKAFLALVSPSGNGIGQRFHDLYDATTTAALTQYWLWLNGNHPTAGLLTR